MMHADGFWAALAAAVVLAIMAAGGAVTWLEDRLYDAAVTITAPPALPEIMLVVIDDASLNAMGPWPWPRDIHAHLVDKLAAAGARTIVLTTVFSEPQADRGLTYVRRMQQAVSRAGDAPQLAAELGQIAAEAEAALDTDARVAASIQRAGNVFLVSRYQLIGTPGPLPLPAQRSVLPDPEGFGVAAQAAQHPIPALGSAAAGIGHLFVTTDPGATVRQVPLLVRYDGAGVPSIALLAARHSLHLAPREVSFQGSPPALQLGSLPITTDTSAVLRPRFHAASGTGSTPFPTVSAAAVLQDKVPPHTLKDKIVLVGETSVAASTPWLSPDARPLYPVELAAHTLSSIRLGLGVLRPWWAGLAGIAAALVAMAFVAVAVPRFSQPAGIAVCLGLALSASVLEWALLRHGGLSLPLLACALALVLGPGAWTALILARRWLPTVRPGDGEADRMMGLALQGRGQLDRALEHFRRAPPSGALMDNLYHLAQDFERERNLAKAKVIYKQILQHDRNFKDVRRRYKRVRALLQPAQTPSSAGQVLPVDATAGSPMLGRYQIDKEIGKGAMGVVYLGRDPQIGRVVAIKTLALSNEFEGDALVDARARFFREAQTAGRLQHPCIVTIFDAGEEHDLAYIAMEFLNGKDLTTASRPGQLLPVETVLSITARVAVALDYAHAHNVVHRDIKPANIMYDGASDAVKVTDFGIARITDSSKTRTGLVLGTPSFMSPEQLAGKKVDGRSDLYSLGVTLFQLLTGSLPLRGESMSELMHKIATAEPPDVRQFRPELPPEIARILALALQKQPEARYQTGRQFAADLRHAGAASGAQSGAPRPGAVVYDAERDATGHEMADFQHTVMEPPAGRAAAASPVPGAR